MRGRDKGLALRSSFLVVPKAYLLSLTFAVFGYPTFPWILLANTIPLLPKLVQVGFLMRATKRLREYSSANAKNSLGRLKKQYYRCSFSNLVSERVRSNVYGMPTLNYCHYSAHLKDKCWEEE